MAARATAFDLHSRTVLKMLSSHGERKTASGASDLWVTKATVGT